MHALLADIVVAVHVLVVLYMLAGIVLVLVGWPLRWGWIRNPWFRFSHLAIMAYIVVNAARGELCFLTIWEGELRERAGQRDLYGTHEERISFVGRLLRDFLYVDDVPQETLHAIYFVVGALVLVMTVCVRPRVRRRLPGQG